MCWCNPLCCIPSRTGCAIVAFLDILLGGFTLLFSSEAIYNFKDCRDFLKKENISDDVAWFGIISIPLVGLIGLWSGFKLMLSICRCTKETHETNHILKFLVFFLAEVVGFIAPFLVYQDYLSKIRAMTNWSNSFLVFRLLEVNPLTIGIFIYQIISFWVVHRHQLLKLESARNANLRKTKPRLLNASNPNGAVVIKEVELRTIQKRNGANSKKNGVQVYPNLNELMIDLLPTPAYTKPAHSAVDVDCKDSDSDSDDSSSFGDSSAFMLRNGLQKAGTKTTFELKKKMFVKQGTLFEDAEFPANNSSLGTGRRFEWKRPREIVKDARFFTDGYSRFDVKQGELGDCWFLAALANLTLNDDLFTRVVPHDNEWADGGLYCGMCHFRFWVNGKWTEVTIDDRLPTRNGKLVFLHSSDKHEFWSALVEKAYAKLNGSYTNLNGNDGIGRAMTNLTSGQVTRHYMTDYEKKLNKLFDLMSQALRNGKMIGCGVYNDNGQDGIFGGHAYSVTHVKRIQLMTGKEVSCIRIRNPWGDENEWTGNFSDGHKIWNLVEKKMRIELQVIFQNDGEFWFPLRQLADYFDMVEICHLP